MTKKTCHIEISGTPWCEWTGSMRGQEIATRTGVHTCTLPSLKIGRSVRRELGGYFKRGVVQIMPGECPNSPA